MKGRAPASFFQKKKLIDSMKPKSHAIVGCMLDKRAIGGYVAN